MALIGMSAWVRASAVSEVFVRSADRFDRVLENIEKVVKIEGLRRETNPEREFALATGPPTVNACGFLMAGSAARSGEAAHYGQLAFAAATRLRQLAKIS
jgi:hypothetical protein